MRASGGHGGGGGCGVASMTFFREGRSRELTDHFESYAPHGSAMGERENHGCGLKKGVRNTLVCVSIHTT
jgi:hypothetical protein